MMLKNELIDYIAKAPKHLLTVENLVSVSGKTKDNIQRHFWFYVEKRLNPTVPVALIERLLAPLYEKIDELTEEIKVVERAMVQLNRALLQSEKKTNDAYFNAILSRVELLRVKHMLCVKLKLDPSTLLTLFRAEEYGFNPEAELNALKHAGASNLRNSAAYPSYGYDADRWCLKLCTREPYDYEAEKKNEFKR